MRVGVEVAAHQYGVRGGNGEVTDAVGLGGTFHEVFMQGFRRVLYGLGFTAGIVGGEFAFPFLRFRLTPVVCRWLFSRRMVSVPATMSHSMLQLELWGR